MIFTKLRCVIVFFCLIETPFFLLKQIVEPWLRRQDTRSSRFLDLPFCLFRKESGFHNYRLGGKGSLSEDFEVSVSDDINNRCLSSLVSLVLFLHSFSNEGPNVFNIDSWTVVLQGILPGVE